MGGGGSDAICWGIDGTCAGCGVAHPVINIDIRAVAASGAAFPALANRLSDP
jgi:hypothetical protein